MTSLPVSSKEKGPELSGVALSVRVAEVVFGEVEAHAPCGDGLTRTDRFYGPTLANCDEQIRRAYPKSLARGELWPAEYCGPDYQGDIASAWLVVEAVARRTRRDLGVRLSGNDADGFWCEFYDTSPMGYVRADGTDVPPLVMEEVHASIAPAALCLAALRAVELDAGSLSTPEGSRP